MVNLALKHKQSFDLIGLKHNHDTDGSDEKGFCKAKSVSNQILKW